MAPMIGLDTWKEPLDLRRFNDGFKMEGEPKNGS